MVRHDFGDGDELALEVFHGKDGAIIFRGITEELDQSVLVGARFLRGSDGDEIFRGESRGVHFAIDLDGVGSTSRTFAMVEVAESDVNFGVGVCGIGRVVRRIVRVNIYKGSLASVVSGSDVFILEASSVSLSDSALSSGSLDLSSSVKDHLVVLLADSGEGATISTRDRVLICYI